MDKIPSVGDSRTYELADAQSYLSFRAKSCYCHQLCPDCMDGCRGFHLGGVCPCCKIYRGRGDFIHQVKYKREFAYLVKKQRGFYPPIQGGFCPFSKLKIWRSHVM